MKLIFAFMVLLGPTASPDLEKKIQSVLPQEKEERWLRIPWEPNLMRARVEAQRVGKPVLIWIMDGNVLGCT